ncbi:glycoside hydrolase family 43 protein [Parathielavia appendiculata]|uniref:Glycoside hydrolase family 43 protein n=1 Tax=Parathielavia appendiculata TaxID=2587402 RepID=A0AAN6Z0C2_9PEZI|nr:glycoside hydrolase family 43 protein [Parathielavia appendiculata]
MKTLACLLTIFVGLGASHPHSSLASRAATFNNPVLWEDYPDLDVFRIGDVFYYSSSTFAYSPGAPVLKSYDLVNWTAVTHSVPKLNFGPQYDLLGGTPAGYVKGIWASTLRYRRSNDRFYWYGCVEQNQTYIWTSSGTNAGVNNGEVPPYKWKWEAHPPINACYYDSGLLIDDDDTMYIAYGNPTIRVAQLSADGLRQVRTQAVYTPPAGTTIEGSRMYRVKGTYYILVTRPADAEWVLKSTTDSPFGPYTARTLVSRINGPLANAGFAHQGGMVDTPDGSWFYVAFMDAYPGGRIPVVAPLRWTSDGWPEVVTDARGNWGTSYPVPVHTSKTVEGKSTELDEFKGKELSHHWEWNHNPDDSKWLLHGDGLLLRTASVTGNLFAARNTLTRRIAGPKSRGTFKLDVGNMKDGDRAGVVLFRDRAAYIGVWKQGGLVQIVVVDDLRLTEGTWTTSSTGRVAATGPTVSNTQDVWLIIEADITPAFGTSTERTTTFAYSIDGGKSFVRFGPAVVMTNSWRYFSGYRFGVFNFATKALGGAIKVKSFQMELV